MQWKLAWMRLESACRIRQGAATQEGEAQVKPLQTQAAELCEGELWLHVRSNLLCLALILHAHECRIITSCDWIAPQLGPTTASEQW